MKKIFYLFCCFIVTSQVIACLDNIVSISLCNESAEEFTLKKIQLYHGEILKIKEHRTHNRINDIIPPKILSYQEDLIIKPESALDIYIEYSPEGFCKKTGIKEEENTLVLGNNNLELEVYWTVIGTLAPYSYKRVSCREKLSTEDETWNVIAVTNTNGIDESFISPNGNKIFTNISIILEKE